jgi:hypothetical protein
MIFAGGVPLTVDGWQDRLARSASAGGSGEQDQDRAVAEAAAAVCK